MARKKVEVPTREELVALTGELNNILGLDPAIKVSKKMTDEELIEKIKEIATDNVYESDCKALSDEDVEGEHFYSEDAVNVFGILGIEIAAGSPPEQSTENPADAEDADAEDAEDAEAEDAEDAEAEEVEEEEVEEEKAPAKGKKEKATPAEKPAKEKKEKAPAKEKATSSTEKRYSRSEALVDAIDAGKGTKAEIIERSNKFFLKHNPNTADGKTTARDMLGYVLPTLILIEYVTYENGVISPVKK